MHEWNVHDSHHSSRRRCISHTKKSCQVRENAREGWKELHYNSVNSALFFSIFFYTLRAFITLRKVTEHDENLHDSCSTRMQRRRWKKRENLIFSSSLQKRERPLRDLMNEKERLQALKSWEKEKFSTPPAAIEWRMKKGEGRFWSRIRSTRRIISAKETSEIDELTLIKIEKESSISLMTIIKNSFENNKNSSLFRSMTPQ